MTSLPVSGSLAETPLPRLLLELHTRRFTGRLELERGRTRKAFWVQDGALVESESDLEGERLARVLEDAGHLSRTDRETVEARSRGGGKAEAAVLLEVEGVDAKQVFEGLREQIRRRAVDCFGWNDGSFQLAASDERRTNVDLFRTEILDLVFQGIQKHWTLEDLLQALAPRMGEYVSGSKRLGKVIRRLRLGATVERMVAGLSGTQTLGQVIGTSAGSPAALAAFWVLDASGALAFSATPVQKKDADGPTEIEIEIRDDAAASTGPGAGAAAQATPAQVEPAAANPEAEKMRAEVLDRLEHLDELDFYELLGVEHDAPHAAIRKAYFLTAKRYHPDAINRLGLQDIRREAGEVFGKIAEANEVLSDPKRRQDYDRQLEGGLPEVDIQRLAQAETFYRKGEILINMGDFRGALEYLKNAVELYPEEAVYQRDLGWAYFKKNPPEPELALRHLDRALEIDPSDSDAQFRRGVVAGGK